jgi:threonine dehydratase
MPDLADIHDARLAIAHKIRRTPLVRSDSLTTRVGAPVHLKLEHHQITGSFKLRGASYAVHRLTAEQRAKGVVGVSTGNHGRGLAQAAKDAGLRCVVCMSSLVPRNKVEAIGALRAEVRIVGASQDEAQVEVDRLVAEDGLTLLPPFDHLDVIAGQGTLGLEIMEELPRIDTLIVPLSGGGLIAGVALAAKTIRPSVRVIGVTMERGAAMYESLKAGRPVPVEERPSLADALGGGIGLDNRYTFPLVRDLVDGVHLVSESQIGDGIRHAYWQEKQVVEGSGAVGIAALLAGFVEDPGTTVVIVSGCNIDMDLHKRVIDGEAVDLDP